MNALQAIVLGVVQGLTEFLPISSSGHLRIVPALLGWVVYGSVMGLLVQVFTDLIHQLLGDEPPPPELLSHGSHITPSCRPCC